MTPYRSKASQSFRLISSLLTFAVWLGGVAPTSAQAQIYVWSGQTNVPGAGTQLDPYASLSYALLSALPGDVIMLAGDAQPYWDDASPALGGESFPITLPAGVEIRFWDRTQALPGAKPPVAVFRKVVQAHPTVCFQITVGDSNDTPTFSTYLPVLLPPDPDDGQGVEVRGFTTGLLVGSFPVDGYKARLDGVAFYDCVQSIKVDSNTGAQSSVEILYSRGMVRPPAGGSIQIDARLGFNGALSLNVIQSDMRALLGDLGAHMIAAFVPNESSMNVSVSDVHISGRDPLGINAPFAINGCGIHCIVVGRDSTASVFLDHARVSDARDDGVFFQNIRSTAAFRAENDCIVENNGSDNAGSLHSASGIHLRNTEEGEWPTIVVEDSRVQSNHRHGLHLEMNSMRDEKDEIGLLRVKNSLLRRNGWDASLNLQGHGFYAQLHNVRLADGAISRCFVTENHTSGIRFDLETDAWQDAPDLVHRFGLVNTVVSLNSGEGATGVGTDYWDTAPVVIQGTDYTTFFGFFAHSTITANNSPWALAVKKVGTVTPAEHLWANGLPIPSSIRYCILNKNHPTQIPGLGLVDAAFYPWDTNDLLWQNLYSHTSFSNLGSQGVPGYAAVNYNQLAHPQLVNWQTVGPVYPGPASIVVNWYNQQTYPPTSVDVLGNDRPDPASNPPAKDIGAFEVQ